MFTCICVTHVPPTDPNVMLTRVFNSYNLSTDPVQDPPGLQKLSIS
jgi:hypothetical protein